LDWSFAHLIAPVVTTTSIILSSNKIQNGHILLPANPGPPGNGRENGEQERERERETERDRKSVITLSSYLWCSLTVTTRDWASFYQKSAMFMLPD